MTHYLEYKTLHSSLAGAMVLVCHLAKKRQALTHTHTHHITKSHTVELVHCAQIQVVVFAAYMFNSIIV